MKDIKKSAILKLISIHCVVHRPSGPLHAGGVKLKIAYLDFSTKKVDTPI